MCYHFSCCSCGRRCHWNGRIEGVLSELLYADDLVWMSETMMGLGNKFREKKELFERLG